MFYHHSRQYWNIIVLREVQKTPEAMVYTDLQFGCVWFDGWFVQWNKYLWERLRNSDQCMTSASAQLLSNMIISVVFHLRWIAVMFSFRYPTVVTVKTTTAIVIICWDLPLICMTPNLIIVMIMAHHVQQTCMTHHVAYKQHTLILEQQTIASVEPKRSWKLIQLCWLFYASLPVYIYQIYVCVLWKHLETDNHLINVITIIA